MGGLAFVFRNGVFYCMRQFTRGASQENRARRSGADQLLKRMMGKKVGTSGSRRREEMPAQYEALLGQDSLSGGLIVSKVWTSLQAASSDF